MLGKIKSSELDMDIYTFILFLQILPTIDTPDNVVRLNKVKTTNIKQGCQIWEKCVRLAFSDEFFLFICLDEPK